MVQSNIATSPEPLLKGMEERGHDTRKSVSFDKQAEAARVREKVNAYKKGKSRKTSPSG